jgi:hypothetical protein
MAPIITGGVKHGTHIQHGTLSHIAREYTSNNSFSGAVGEPKNAL